MLSRRIAAVLAIGVLAAACSSNSNKTGSTTVPTTGGTSPSSKVAAPTGTPIVIGNIGSYSGPIASGITGGETVIKAWAQAVNASGGINGHPINLIVKDDGSNPTTGETEAKELIQQDHVVAIVSDLSGVDTTWAPLAQAAGVPVIGGVTLNPNWLKYSDFFPAGTDLIANLYNMLSLANKSFGTKVGYLYCAEIAACAQSVGLFKGIAQAAGDTVPYVAAVSSSAADYTAVCQGLKNSGVQSLQIAESASEVSLIAGDCAQQGVTAKQLAEDGSISPSWLSQPALNGALAAETDAPFFDTSTPATQAYRAFLQQYAPNLGTFDNSDASYAYIAGKLFQKAVENIGSGPVTAASIKAALYAMHGETLGGLTPPLTFTQNAPTLINCGFSFAIQGGHFTEPNGLNMTCAPSALVNGIEAQILKS